MAVKKSLNFYLTVIIGVLLLILYYQTYHQASESTRIVGDTGGVVVTNGISDVALASIAVGPKARFYAAYLIRSFVRNSKFRGNFYLITDKPSYFDYMQDDFDAHPDTKVVFLKITDRTIGGFPLPMLPLSTIFKENRYGHVQWQRLSDSKRKRLEIKWLKTKLFEFIPDHQYVIFMDSDMLIGQSMESFIRTCKRLKKQKGGDAIVTLFVDIGNTGSPYHTGVIWFNRMTSIPLLSVWGVTISKGIFTSDQRAIEYSINELDVADRVAFIPIDDKTKLFCFINGTVVDQKLPYTFIHTTSYRLFNGEKFHFTNETLAEYFGETINTPWRPWTGAASMSQEDNEKQLLDQIQLKEAFVKRLKESPFPRQTVIDRHQAELDDLLKQLEILRRGPKPGDEEEQEMGDAD